MFQQKKRHKGKYCRSSQRVFTPKRESDKVICERANVDSLNSASVHSEEPNLPNRFCFAVCYKKKICTQLLLKNLLTHSFFHFFLMQIWVVCKFGFFCAMFQSKQQRFLFCFVPPLLPLFSLFFMTYYYLSSFTSTKIEKKQKKQ